MSFLRRGLAGEPVKRLQIRLGVEADGEFGPATEKALKDYQQKNGLNPDGIAGPETFWQMGLYELVLLKVGSSGELVKRLQAALTINVDGQYGPGTAEELKKFQAKSGINSDGIAGPETLSKMEPFKEFTPEVVTISRLSEGNGKSKSIWDTVRGFFK